MSADENESENDKVPLWVHEEMVQRGKDWRERADKMLEYSHDGPNQFSRKFLATFHADFLQYGAAVIAAVRETKPDVYLRTAAQLVPKEFLIQVAKPMSDMSDAELARMAMDAAPRLVERMAQEAEASDDGEDEAEEG
jgi:hypothetical protein